MTNYSKIYWFERLDGINALVIAIIVFLVIGIIVISIGVPLSRDFNDFYHSEKLEKRKSIQDSFFKKLKWMIPLMLSLASISIFIPTKKDVIEIIAGGKTIDFIQSDSSINKIPEQTTAIISNFLDKQIKEINYK